MKEIILLKEKTYFVSLEDCKNFISIPEDKMISWFKKNPIDDVKGISFHESAYLITEFFRKHSEKIELLSEEMKQKYKKLINYQYGDFEYVRELEIGRENNDRAILFSIHPYLRKALYQNIPSNYSNIERIFYLYFKLCFLLSYSEAFFIQNQKELFGITLKGNIGRLNHITPQNNEVVCYEFAQIMNQLIEEEGHFVQRHVNNYGCDNQHDSTNAVIDKYIIELDAVMSVFFGDLVQVKLGRSFNGINPYNTCEDTIKEMSRLAMKVYQDVQKEFSNKHTSYKYPNNMIKNIMQQVDKLCIDEKEKYYLGQFLTNVNNLNLNKMDFASSLITLFNDIDNYFKNSRINLELVGKIDDESHVVGLLSIGNEVECRKHILLEDYQLSMLEEKQLLSMASSGKLISLYRGSGILDSLSDEKIKMIRINRNKN